MLTASLFGTTTYAFTQAEEKLNDQLPATEAEGGIQAANKPTDGEDIPSDEEKQATEQLDRQKRAERDEKKSDRNNRKPDKTPISWVSILALVVGAGGVAMGVTNRKSLVNLDNKNKDLKNSTAKSLTEITGRIDAIQQDLAAARQKIDRQEKEINNLRLTQNNLKASMNSPLDIQGSPLTDASVQNYQAAATIAPQQPAQQTIKLLYCGAPKDGVFTNPSRTPTNKALYVITYTGDIPSHYSFVDTREGAMLAARSTSEFLDPGCVISGAKNPNFTKVKTINPGTVRRSQNGCWVIESKAVVELV